MVTKISPLTGTDLDNEINERNENYLLEESRETERDPVNKQKGKVVPFRHTRAEVTDSVDSEDGVRTNEGTRAASSLSGRLYSDSQRELETSRDSGSDQPSFEFLETMKMHFLTPILDAFDKVQLHANSSNCAFYIDGILHTIRDMGDKSPRDPFLDILFALYDALAFNHNWTKYTAAQYEEVKKVLQKYSTRSRLDQTAIEKAIEELEVIGLDTTPFVLDMEIPQE